MKNKKFIYIANWLLLFSIPTMLLTIDVKTDTTTSSISVKNMPTSLFIQALEQEEKIDIKSYVDDRIVVVKDEEVITKDNLVEKKEEISKEVIVSKEVETNEIKAIDLVQSEVVQEEKKEEKQEVVNDTKTEVKVEEKTDVIESYTGNLSYYRANCSGCSGFTATGFDVRDGKLYYNDSAYGNVRIVATGSEIPKYSIVRIKNSSLGSEILAIALDRGGDIGQGKKFLVDVLTNSVEARGGVDRNITVEVIRRGK